MHAIVLHIVDQSAKQVCNLWHICQVGLLYVGGSLTLTGPDKASELCPCERATQQHNITAGHNFESVWLYKRSTLTSSFSCVQQCPTVLVCCVVLPCKQYSPNKLSRRSWCQVDCDTDLCCLCYHHNAVLGKKPAVKPCSQTPT